MRMYIDGDWCDSAQKMSVVEPYTGDTIDTVPDASTEDVEHTLAAAVRGAREMAALTAYERAQILNRAADQCAAEVETLTTLIAREVGRAADMLRLAAFEGSQLRGETLPLDANAATTGKLGFTLRHPCGVVVAITPFNYPSLLVLHKIGPALATGNAVILKPATNTPLTALALTRILLEAGLPPNALQCITGSGARLGPALCADPRVRKISFTGSTAVGEAIAGCTGVKKLSLELGSACPMVVMPDADLDAVAKATATAGYVNAGQVCISLQRVLVHEKVYGDYLDAVKAPVEAIKVGGSLEPGTQLSAMITETEAERVSAWVDEAVAHGAQLVTGGARDGAVMQPTLLADVKPEMRVFKDEVFGPAVAATPVSATPVSDIDHAIELANDSRYGLAAAIFTQDVRNAMRFAQAAESGNDHVNWTPLWRADLMPYGGVKGSGFGKESIRYAAEEMTEMKTVVFHGLD